MKSQTVKKVAKEFEKELQKLYGKVVYVSSAFGYPGDLKEDPCDFLYVFTDTAKVRKAIPSEYEGFPVKVLGIPRAG